RHWFASATPGVLDSFHSHIAQSNWGHTLRHCHEEAKTAESTPMRHWMRIADNLRNAGFSWGYSCESDLTGRVLFTADAYAPDGRRFTVLADDRLTAFVELRAAIHRQGETG